MAKKKWKSEEKSSDPILEVNEQMVVESEKEEQERLEQIQDKQASDLKCHPKFSKFKNQGSK